MPPGRAPVWGCIVGRALPSPGSRLWRAAFGCVVRSAVGRGPPPRGAFPARTNKNGEGSPRRSCSSFPELVILTKSSPPATCPWPAIRGRPASFRRRLGGSHSTPLAVARPLGERLSCCRQWLTGRERPGYLPAYSGILQCKKIPPYEEGKGYSCEPRTFENTHLIA